MNLAILSVTSKSVTVALFVSAIGAPTRLITMFITLFSTVGDGFVTLFESDEKQNNKYT